MKSEGISKEYENVPIRSIADDDSICFTPQDLLAELGSKNNLVDFSNWVPFRQGPYLDAPFSQFPNFMNSTR